MKVYSLIILSLLYYLTGCSQNKIFNQASAIYINVGPSPSKTSIADLNKDGINDILVATSDGMVVLLNDGNGNFAQPEGSPFPAGNEPADIGTADFNNDGNLDLAIPNHEKDEITILLNNGKGNFSKAFYKSLKLDLNPHAHSVAVSDLNNDGNVDLAVTNFLGSEIIVEWGDGKGNFIENTEHIKVPNYPYRNVKIFDINVDGNPDIITPANSNNAVTILLGNNKGNFSAAPNSPFNINDNPFFVIIGDFNKDSHPDIAVSNFDSGNISVLTGNKLNDFSTSKLKSFKVGEKPVCLAKDDFNNDGIPDIVCANYESNNVTILLGNKSSIFDLHPQNIAVGSAPYGVAAGDLNGDNKPDIVTANFESDNITILFNAAE